MGEPHQFRVSVAQPNSSFSVSQNSQSSQETTSTPGPPSFSSPSTSSIFSLPSQKMDFGSSKSTIFGGSAFARPTENSFAPPGKQSIFGGTPLIPQPTSPQKTELTANTTQTSLFGKPEISLPGKSSNFGTTFTKSTEEVSSANTIFGGAFMASQSSSLKSSALSDVVPKTTESTNTLKPNIFGGAYVKKEEPSQKPDIYDSTKARDLIYDESSERSKSTVLFGTLKESTKISFDSRTFNDPSEKHLLFASSHPPSGRFTSSGMVTSSVSHQTKERTDNSASYKNFVEEEESYLSSEKRLEEQDPDWEPDTLNDRSQEGKTLNQPRPSIRSTKIARKHGVFGKAIEDVAMSSQRKYTNI